MVIGTRLQLGGSTPISGIMAELSYGSSIYLIAFLGSVSLRGFGFDQWSDAGFLPNILVYRET